MMNVLAGSKKQKGLNFELNLIPIFDILSVCICFLLLTVAWIRIGSMNVSQSMGSEARDHQENQPAVWAYMDSSGKVTMTLKNASGLPRNLTNVAVAGQKGTIQWDSVINYLAALQKFGPSLRTGFIMPDHSSSYEDIVKLMDQFKRFGIKDIGLAPL